MFEIKYYLDGIELKNEMVVRFKCENAYGYVYEECPIFRKNNKLFLQFRDNNVREVDDIFYVPIKIISE